MKKKIYTVVLCTFMCVVMCVPVLAVDGYAFVGSAEGLYSHYSDSPPFDISDKLVCYYSGLNGSTTYEVGVYIPKGSVIYISEDKQSYCILDSSGKTCLGYAIQCYDYNTYNWFGNPYFGIGVFEASETMHSLSFPTKVFDSKEHALSYISDGSLDGLVSDGSKDIIKYDSSVPAPTEVHIESRYLADEGCPRTTIAFKSSETYESSGMQTEIRYRYSGTFYESGVFGDSKTNRKAFTSPIYKKDLIKTLSVNYVGNTSNSNTVIMNWYDEFMDNDAYKNYAEYKEVEANKHSISWIAAPFNSIEYWIRNVSNDNKASDWVHCKYNYDTGELEETWTDTVPGGRTDVIDGSVEPGEETPGDIKDSYEIDSSIKNDGGFDNNSSGLISSIKDLFSDNGVVGMVKDILGFMPGWMIAYVSLFFTILIALMILYFVRG